MALMMRHPKQKESLVALSVINDNNTSETKELIGKRNLERTAMIAAAADASVRLCCVMIEYCARYYSYAERICGNGYCNRFAS